jgi:PAS domain S-box-containing protein
MRQSSASQPGRPERASGVAFAAMHAPNEAAEWERLFRLVFERSSNPILLLDDQRRIVEVNDAAVALFGGERERLVGDSIVDSIRPAERDRAAHEWDAFLRSGEYSGTRVLLRADGSEVQIDFAARIALVGGQRLAVYVAAGDDPSYSPASAPAAELPLTEREREIVTLIALGRETAQIAAELHISPETVRTHVRNAMARLGAHTRAQLVATVLCGEHAVHSSCVPE